MNNLALQISIYNKLKKWKNRCIYLVYTRPLKSAQKNYSAVAYHECYWFHVEAPYMHSGILLYLSNNAWLWDFLPKVTCRLTSMMSSANVKKKMGRRRVQTCIEYCPDECHYHCCLSENRWKKCSLPSQLKCEFAIL